jgi:hypothetical protein
MCQTCQSLNQKIAAAVADHDQKRERVMRVLLENHLRDTCSERVIVQGNNQMPAWVLAPEAKR